MAPLEESKTHGAGDVAKASKRADVLNLDDERVCALRLAFVACTAAPDLGGCGLKIKCRAPGGATIMKTQALSAPHGGGELPVPKASRDLVYEGERELEFELCGARFLRSSAVRATGRLPMAAIFGCTSQEFWRLQLRGQSGRRLATLTVSLRHRFERLGKCGGTAALRALALPSQKWDAVPASLGGAQAHQMLHSHHCSEVRKQLQQACLAACDAAKAPQTAEAIVAAQKVMDLDCELQDEMEVGATESEWIHRLLK